MTEIIRLPQLVEETGLSRSTIYRMIQNNEFPPPIKLTPNGRASGWLRNEYNAWKQSRIKREEWRA
ncbi:MAG: AlpA family phage regulatory protein [Ketobacter sp.]|nr:AlpA family phage regulatory protein [Ketobacter sp.]